MLHGGLDSVVNANVTLDLSGGDRLVFRTRLGSGQPEFVALLPWGAARAIPRIGRGISGDSGSLFSRCAAVPCARETRAVLGRAAGIPRDLGII